MILSNTNIPQEWYVVDISTNQTYGPYLPNQIMQLYYEGKITADTYVTYQGAGRVAQLRDSVFATQLSSPAFSSPQRLIQQTQTYLRPVKNIWVWFPLIFNIAFSLLSCFFHELNNYSWIGCIVFILSLLFDFREIKKAGYCLGIWAILGFICMPIYLFVRAAKTDKRYTCAVVYTILSLLGVFILIGLFFCGALIAAGL